MNAELNGNHITAAWRQKAGGVAGQDVYAWNHRIVLGASGLAGGSPADPAGFPNSNELFFSFGGTKLNAGTHADLRGTWADLMMSGSKGTNYPQGMRIFRDGVQKASTGTSPTGFSTISVDFIAIFNGLVEIEYFYVFAEFITDQGFAQEIMENPYGFFSMPNYVYYGFPAKFRSRGFII